MGKEIIDRALDGQTAVLKSLLNDPDKIQEFVLQVVEAFNRGAKLIVAGGSRMGPVANLVADIFLHRLDLERPLLPACSLCHDFTLARTLNRDGLGAQVLLRPFRALASEGDILLLLGDLSPDDALEELFNAAREDGFQTAALLPEKNNSGSVKPDFLFPFATTSAARSTEAALFFGHLLCEMVESELFGTC